MKVKIKIKKLNPNASIPCYGTQGSAACDIKACINENITIFPGQTKLIPTGFATQIPDDWFGAVYARSGLSVKNGLRPANCVAVIDSDYRGEWLIPLYNDSNSVQTIHNDDRIAQVIFQECPVVTFEVTDELNDTERDCGGFGSTGN